MDDLVYYVVGFSLTIIGMLAGGFYWLGRKFAEMDARFREVEGRIDAMERRIDAVASSVVSVNSMLVEFLGLKGLLSREDFVKGEATRLAGLARSNPVSDAELQFLREVFAKELDAITVEDMERAADIAVRWWKEGGGERAFKLFLYAWIIRTYKVMQQRGRGR